MVILRNGLKLTIVSIVLLLLGTHSINMAPLAGALPPTPNPRTENERQKNQKEGENIIANPRIAVITSVSRYTGRRPILSATEPQIRAPQNCPILFGNVKVSDRRYL